MGFEVVLLALLGVGVFLAGAALQVFCVFWAPVAGIMCFRLARKEGLNVAYHAVFGVVYALLLLAPWIYLMRRMRNGEFSKGDYVSSYVLVYMFWGNVLLFHFIYAMIAHGDANPWYRAYFVGFEDALALRLAAYLLVPTLVGAFLMIKSLKELRRRQLVGEMYQRLYIMPFAGASATFAIVAFTWLFLYGLYFTAF